MMMALQQRDCRLDSTMNDRQAKHIVLAVTDFAMEMHTEICIKK